MVAVALVLATALAHLAPFSSSAAAAKPLTPAEQAVKSAVQRLWEDLDVAAATGDQAALPPLFDLQSAAGRASLAHARARLAFVQAWAGARDVRWLLPQVSVRTPAIRFSGDTFARMTAIVSEAWSYEYVSPGASREAVSAFGLGREHHMTLQRTDNGWTIMQDRFTDPLDQDTRIPGPARPSGPAPASRTSLPALARGGYNRAGAVAYANRYCGAAPGCGNGGGYNRRFYDYNGEGGDCTNFVSQALSLGGRLRRNPAWTYDPRTGEGTPAWVQSSTLVDYLVGAGLARIIARGAYGQVAGEVAGLSPGDIIAYAENAKIVHLSMVTAFDPRGYALVDSHTADRYHVPWDIGWDRGARFILLHMTGGAAAQTAAMPGLPLAQAAGCGPAGGALG